MFPADLAFHFLDIAAATPGPPRGDGPTLGSDPAVSPEFLQILAALQDSLAGRSFVFDPETLLHASSSKSVETPDSDQPGSGSVEDPVAALLVSPPLWILQAHPVARPADEAVLTGGTGPEPAGTVPSSVDHAGDKQTVLPAETTPLQRFVLPNLGIDAPVATMSAGNGGQTFENIRLAAPLSPSTENDTEPAPVRPIPDSDPYRIKVPIEPRETPLSPSTGVFGSPRTEWPTASQAPPGLQSTLMAHTEARRSGHDPQTQPASERTPEGMRLQQLADHDSVQKVSTRSHHDSGDFPNRNARPHPQVDASEAGTTARSVVTPPSSVTGSFTVDPDGELAPRPSARTELPQTPVRGLEAQSAALPYTESVREVMTVPVEGPARTQQIPSDLLTQIANHAKHARVREFDEITLHLKPDHLGKISIKAVMEEGYLVTRISVENSHVERYLTEHVGGLRHSLEELGLKVFRVDVEGSTASPAFTQTGTSSQGQPQTPQNGPSHPQAPVLPVDEENIEVEPTVFNSGRHLDLRV